MTDAPTYPFTSLNELSPHYTTLALWPEAQPAAAPSTLTQHYIERGDAHCHDRLTKHTTHPEITVITPPEPNGIGLLLIPGGGYSKIAYDKEGIDIAQTLRSYGYTCFVLNYRLPGDGHALGSNATLADAQRAMRLIRHQQSTWHLSCLGAVGFSAGGHLAGWLGAAYAQETYNKHAPCDEVSARPDFLGLLYPVISMNAEVTHLGSRQQLLGTLAHETLHPTYSIETMVHDKMPPCFLLHASDDPAVSAENSLIMWQALKAKHIPVEMHLVETGGHGFGIRQTAGLPVSAWPQWLHQWIAHHKFA